MTRHYDRIDQAIDEALGPSGIRVEDYDHFLKRLVARASFAISQSEGERIAIAYLQGVENSLAHPITAQGAEQ